jgi:hypothetical protein
MGSPTVPSTRRLERLQRSKHEAKVVKDRWISRSDRLC